MHNFTWIHSIKLCYYHDYKNWLFSISFCVFKQVFQYFWLVINNRLLRYPVDSRVRHGLVFVPTGWCGWKWLRFGFVSTFALLVLSDLWCSARKEKKNKQKTQKMWLHHWNMRSSSLNFSRTAIIVVHTEPTSPQFSVSPWAVCAGARTTALGSAGTETKIIGSHQYCSCWWKMRRATPTREGNKSVLATCGCTKHPKITSVVVRGRGTCADSDQLGGILPDWLQELRSVVRHFKKRPEKLRSNVGSSQQE